MIKFHTPYHNIAQYINDIRLKLCLLDILDSSEFIQDIAYKHGFNHFLVKQKESNIKLIYWLKGSGKINLDLDTYNMKKEISYLLC